MWASFIDSVEIAVQSTVEFSLQNMAVLQGFSECLKLEDGDNYLDEPNSTGFIDTTHATLVKAVVYMLEFSY